MKIREGAAEGILRIMIAGVVSILGLRFYLSLMNYPQIGSGVWHVSHALTGGVIMFGGILLMIIWEGKQVSRWAEVVIGVGWGLFIDEIGKYVTSDYNYFFRPAIMIIYILFVLMFLGYKYLDRRRVRNNRLFQDRRERWIHSLVSKKQIMWGLVIYAVAYSGEKIYEFIKIVTASQKMLMIRNYFDNYSFLGRTDYALIWLKMVIDGGAAVLFLLGARYYWTKKRLRGLNFFRYGLLISILLGSIVRFYFEQLGGILDLVTGMILLMVLDGYKRTIKITYSSTNKQ